jgi:hypothetical protein
MGISSFEHVRKHKSEERKQDMSAEQTLSSQEQSNQIVSNKKRKLKKVNTE